MFITMIIRKQYTRQTCKLPCHCTKEKTKLSRKA